jgi:hypothetical protein
MLLGWGGRQIAPTGTHGSSCWAAHTCCRHRAEQQCPGRSHSPGPATETGCAASCLAKLAAPRMACASTHCTVLLARCMPASTCGRRQPPACSLHRRVQAPCTAQHVHGGTQLSVDPTGAQLRLVRRTGTVVAPEDTCMRSQHSTAPPVSSLVCAAAPRHSKHLLHMLVHQHFDQVSTNRLRSRFHGGKAASLVGGLLPSPLSPASSAAAALQMELCGVGARGGGQHEHPMPDLRAMECAAVCKRPSSR